VARSDPAVQDPVALVRAMWDATRDRDVDSGMKLVHPDIEWVPLFEEGPSIHGAEALRLRLEEIAGSGVVAEAYPLSFELLDDGRVLVVGALRVRRPDNWMTTVQRWWIYVIQDDLVRRVQACDSREQACASPVVP
jgi:hypothetical protein